MRCAEQLDDAAALFVVVLRLATVWVRMIVVAWHALGVGAGDAMLDLADKCGSRKTIEAPRAGIPGRGMLEHTVGGAQVVHVPLQVQQLPDPTERQGRQHHRGHQTARHQALRCRSHWKPAQDST